MRDAIVFIHIPKTAGTAFSHYLFDNIADPDRSRMRFYGDYSIYDGAAELKLVCGHTLFCEMASRFPAASFVTWLRHPIDRAVSQYKSWHNPANFHPHWQENAGTEGCDHIRLAQQMSFEKFVWSDHPAIISSIVNVQTAYLSSWRNGNYMLLSSAQENLVHRFPFFGIVERFEESLALFRDAFGWKAEFPENESVANRSAKQEIHLSSRIVDRILEMNALDLELYRFARLLFEERLRRLRSPRV